MHKSKNCNKIIFNRLSNYTFKGGLNCDFFNNNPAYYNSNTITYTSPDVYKSLERI